MKFWTVQSSNVAEIVKEKGIFRPDFSKSRYIQRNENLSYLYNKLLDNFNTINNMELPGIIYAFAKREKGQIIPIENYDEFKKFIRVKNAVIAGLWKNLSKEDCRILELDYDNTFNPIFIDINDFQFIMPPITTSGISSYTKESVYRIYTDMRKGEISPSEFPSDVIQAHLPYIKKDNLINIHPMFSI